MLWADCTAGNISVPKAEMPGLFQRQKGSLMALGKLAPPSLAGFLAPHGLTLLGVAVVAGLVCAYKTFNVAGVPNPGPQGNLGMSASFFCVSRFARMH